MFLKIVGTIFEVIPSAKKLFTKNEKKKWLCLLELKLIKKLIFPYKRAGFFVIYKNSNYACNKNMISS